MGDKLVVGHTRIIGMPNAIASTFFRHGYNSYADNMRMRIYDGKKIVALREAKHWNQADLARETGLKQPSIWALEKEETKMPKYSTLKAVADALGVPVRDILKKAPKGKEAADIVDDLMVTIDKLTDDNKVALLAAARALRDSQKRR